MTPPASQQQHGVFVEMRVLVGGAVALVGIGLLAVFLWMVPSAATREVHAACQGMKLLQPNPAAQCDNIGDPETKRRCERTKFLADMLGCKRGEPCRFPLPAPEFTAVDFQGKPVHLSDFRGKVVLLNFWASWCGVCEEEKPHLAQMSSDLAGDRFVVVALASDKSWSEVLLAIMKALAPDAQLPSAPPGQEVPLKSALAAYDATLPSGLPFQVLLDPPHGDDNIGPITASWGIHAVPDSALIDREGNIRAYFYNKREWDAPVAETCIRSLIDDRTGTD